MTGDRAGHRAAHQVHPGRLDRDPRDGRLLRADEGIQRHYDRVAEELALVEDDDRDAAHPGARDRAGLQAAQADAAGPRLRQGDPAERLEAVTVDVDPEDTDAAAGASGTTREIPSRSRCSTRRTGRSPGRSSTTSATSATRQPARRGHRLHPGVRASGTGGSSSCTTRARCGSRAGCCSPRA